MVGRCTAVIVFFLSLFSNLFFFAFFPQGKAAFSYNCRLPVVDHSPLFEKVMSSSFLFNPCKVNMRGVL